MIVNKDKKSISKGIGTTIAISICVALLIVFGNTFIKIIMALVLILCLFVYRYDIIPLLGVRRRKISKKSATQVPEGDKWFNDYFTIRYINDHTIAIGEPRYWQRNYSYLILGEEQALLFDCGSGYKDISEVVKSLTKLPVVLMISHYHYDHVGNIDKFDTIYLANNQIDRQSILENNTIKPSSKSHLGVAEGLKSKKFQFAQVLNNKEYLELGNRQVQILYATGHDNQSIAIYDTKTDTLFAGDYLMKGSIIASKTLMPTASLLDYKISTDNICEIINRATTIFVAHPVDYNNQPLKGIDVFDLQKVLKCLQKNGLLIKKKVINDNLYLLY